MKTVCVANKISMFVIVSFKVLCVLYVLFKCNLGFACIYHGKRLNILECFDCPLVWIRVTRSGFALAPFSACSGLGVLFNYWQPTSPLSGASVLWWSLLR